MVRVNNLCTGGVDGMEAIRQDLESAVAAATVCEDEAKVAIPIAEKASRKEEHPSPVEDAGSIEKAETIKSEGMDFDNVEHTEKPSDVLTTQPDEVKRTKDEFSTDDTSSGPPTCGEVEVTTTLPAALNEVEVSTLAPDTCAEVEVSTSTPEDILVKSEVKEEPVKIKDEGSTVTDVSSIV